MPLPAVTRGVFYGLPSNVEVECGEYSCPSVPGLTYIRVRCFVLYDIGLARGPIVQEFVFVHVRRDEVMRGMPPPPPPDTLDWV